MENSTLSFPYGIDDNVTFYNDSASNLNNIYDYLFDYSQIEYPKTKKTVPFVELLIKAIVTAQVMLVSLIGNALIVMVVMWNKSLRTTTNYFIVNLAISDLLVTISCTWVLLVNDVTEGYVLGVFFCKFNTFAQVVSCVTSILSMVLIACDRFFGIVFAMKAHIIERSARNSLIVIWLISSAVGSPMLFVRTLHSRQWKDHNEQWCDDQWPPGNFLTYRRAYWTFITVILFFIPLLVMAGAYCGIIKTLWTAKAPGERLAKDVNIQIKVKRKVVMMLVTLLAVFAVCWFPIQFSVLYAEYRPNTHQMLEEWYDDFSFFAYFLAFSNSAINPVVYTAFNENFRKDFISMNLMTNQIGDDRIFDNIGLLVNGFKKMFGCYKKKRYATLTRMDESTYPSTITLSTSVTRM